MKPSNIHRLLALAHYGLSLDGLRDGQPNTTKSLHPLAIVDDRTPEQKEQDGDADEPYCPRCHWPVRLCVCDTEVAQSRDMLGRWIIHLPNQEVSCLREAVFWHEIKKLLLPTTLTEGATNV